MKPHIHQNIFFVCNYFVFLLLLKKSSLLKSLYAIIDGCTCKKFVFFGTDTMRKDYIQDSITPVLLYLTLARYDFGFVKVVCFAARNVDKKFLFFIRRPICGFAQYLSTTSQHSNILWNLYFYFLHFYNFMFFKSLILVMNFIRMFVYRCMLTL
jgi:hypothetical protein